jgi:beta-lactamase class A
MRSLLRRLAHLVLAAFAFAGAAPARAQGAPGREAALELLASIRPSPELQTFLDARLDAILARDAELRRSILRVALVDLGATGGGGGAHAPRLAARDGDVPIYPASVIKFVYLMAAHAFADEGRLEIDAELDAALGEMIRVSSNAATQRVFARLTGTEPGPELPAGAYAEYRERRLAVQRWLDALGVRGLHCVNPTYDGGGDLAGRDAQFLRDASVPGGLPSGDGEYANRNAMTATGTAALLALLATDRALPPERAEAVRERMRRDPREQPHLAARIAGGAARRPGLAVYAKSGTWGPIYADAGIVRELATDRTFALAVFTEARPPYRGTAIADLTEAAARELFRPAGAGP